MTQVNLLPWREQARKEQQTLFGIQVGIFLVITIVIVFIIHLFLSGVIGRQQARNNYLQTELNNKQIELQALQQKKKEELVVQTQLDFLLNMREKSYSAVRLLTELDKTVPTDISLNLVKRQGDAVTLQGLAETDLDITLFMKNIAKSQVLEQPVLTEISSKDTDKVETKYFQIKIKLKGFNKANAKT